MSLTLLKKHSKTEHNHLHHQLPYRFFDNDHSLFHNTTSIGFGFQLNVLGGANDSAIEALNKILTTLP